MLQNAEFINALKSKLTSAGGVSIAQSVLQNSLAKLKKNVESLTVDDRARLIEYIIEAISLVVTKDESKSLKSELENLLKADS